MADIAAPRLPAWTYAAVGTGALAATVAVRPSATVIGIVMAPAAVLALCFWVILNPDRWLKGLFCFALLLPPFPILLGNTGPHPCLIFIALGGFAGVLRLAEWRIRNDSLTQSLLLFVMILLFSAGLAGLYSGIAIAAGTLARILLFGSSIYVFFYVAYGPGARTVEPWRMSRFLFWCGTLSALFACADFYFQLPAPAGFGPQFVWLDTGVFRRAQGLFYEASTLGNVCVFFLVMVAVALSRPRQWMPVSRVCLLAGACVFAAALVFSYSRASVLNLLVSLAALLWLDRSRFRGRARRVALASALSAGALISYWAFPAFARLYWTRLSGSVLGFFTNTEGTLTGRVSSWRELARFLTENPWHAVAGVGYKTLPYSSFTGQPVVADNMYLSILVETGIFGLAAMLLVNVSILRAAYRGARCQTADANFLGTWIFCFWIGQLFQMLSGDLLTYWRVLPLYFFILAAAVRATPDPEYP
jgi:O-antigen ligase